MKLEHRNMFTKLIVIYVTFLASGILAEIGDDDTNIRNVQSVNDVQTVATKTWKSVQDKLGLSVNESLIPAVNEGEIMLEEMCVKNAANGTHQTARMAMKNILSCFNDIIVFSELPAKVEEAKMKGNLDQVFYGYCRRTDEIKVCVSRFLLDVEPCLAYDQKSSKYTMQNITEAILKFACENEGDYIALFISEKGPQCINNKQPGIERCIRKYMNDTKSFESYTEMINNGTDFNSLGSEEERPFSFLFDFQQCRTAYKIRTCIIEELKTCNGSTPANVVESIFNLIQRSTTCSKFSCKQLDSDDLNCNSSDSIVMSMFSIIIPVVTILLSRFLSR